jgi:SAM-dependent methyltransferase
MTEQAVGAPSWADFERAGWDTRAEAYHSFFAPICQHVADAVLDAVRARAGTRVLDACCGPGYLAGQAVARGCSVEGVDISPAMVELATRLQPAATFTVGDVESLPYAAGSFDAVVCNIGIHHVTDPARAVAEFARVLAPGGRLALTVWDDARSEIGIVKAAIAAAEPVAPADLPTPPTRPAYDDEGDVRRLLAPAGFRVRELRPITFPQRYPDAASVWDGWLPTAIRTGPLLAAQPPEVRQAARAAFDRMVAEHVAADGSVTLPASLVLVVAET